MEIFWEEVAKSKETLIIDLSSDAPKELSPRCDFQYYPNEGGQAEFGHMTVRYYNGLKYLIKMMYFINIWCLIPGKAPVYLPKQPGTIFQLGGWQRDFPDRFESAGYDYHQ